MKKLLLLVMTIMLVSTGLFAQAQSNTADLLGTVKDQTGAILPGTTLTVTNVETGFTRSTVASDQGAYRLPLLPPGAYEVRAELPGFATKVYASITLTVGQYANLDIVLEVSATQMEVVVQANAAIIEREKTVQASTIQEVEIDNLPINGRNYLDFTLLTPGVSDQNTMVTSAAVQLPPPPSLSRGRTREAIM